MAGNKNSGRHRKTHQELKLYGNYRPDRHGEVEPEAAGVPRCPEGLDEQAAWLWDQVVDHAVSVGAGSVDTAPLVKACQFWSDSVHSRGLADSARRELDMLMDAKQDRPWTDAEADSYAAACIFRDKHERAEIRTWTECSKLLSAFGVTPAMRARLRGAGQKEGNDPLEEFIA